MDLRQLRYFLAVATEKHFGRAAESLNIVQPALSMQIRALEDELGGALFLRTSRRVELTEAGKVFAIEAQRTLEQADFAKRSAERALRGETGIVRIGFAGNAIFSGRLMHDLRDFHQRYPDVELQLEEIAPQRQVEAILTGLLDIGYTPDHSTLHAEGLVAQRVGEWNMLVALHENHRFARCPELTLGMLADEPLVLYDAHDEDERLSVMLSQKLGQRLNIVRRTGSSLNVLAMAAAGLGLALVPAPLQQVSVPGLRYCRLNAPALTANLMLIGRKDEKSAAVRTWLERATQNGRALT